MFSISCPLVLLYHGVPRRAANHSIDAKAFEEHIRFLKQHCVFISAEEYCEVQSTLRRPTVMLTFDDGFRNNAEIVADMLLKHNVPATFFICSLHSAPGKYLWFTYLRMLYAWFSGDRMKIDGTEIEFSSDRKTTVANIKRRLLGLRPHPQAMYECISTLPPLEDFVPRSVIADEGEGMTPQLIQQLAAEPLFAVGGHTVDHPYLTICTPEEVKHQVHDNKVWIEQLSGKRCRLFAYPGGLFDNSVLNLCRSEYEQAFALEWSAISDQHYAVHRIGVCSRSRIRLGIKLWAGRWIPYEHIEPIRGIVQKPSVA